MGPSWRGVGLRARQPRGVRSPGARFAGLGTEKVFNFVPRADDPSLPPVAEVRRGCSVRLADLGLVRDDPEARRLWGAHRAYAATPRVLRMAVLLADPAAPPAPPPPGR